MEKKLKIGFVCREYPPCNNGGVGKFTKDLAEGLVSRGHEVVVFGIYAKNVLDIKVPVIETINGVIVYRYPKKITKFGPYIDDIIERLQYRKRLKKIISKYKLDLLESNDSTGQMAFFRSRKLITRLHGSVTYISSEINRKFSRFISFFEKLQLKNSIRIISVSNYTLGKTLNYFHISHPGTQTIYNSIPDSFFMQKESDPLKRITYFGQITAKKGVWQLCKAINNVFDKYPEYELLLIGKNAEASKSELLSLVKTEYHKNIKIISHLAYDELRRIVSTSYCCVFPSFVECFSLTPMEAMALGVPVIYSSLHSGPELITDSENGFLVNPNNVDEISEKIIYLIENPEIANTIGLKGQELIKSRFNYNDWLDENIQLYSSLIYKQ
jgi:glycosyltransferase involved in cell wall biosynthesis